MGTIISLYNINLKKLTKNHSLCSSAEDVMNAKGIMLINYLEKGRLLLDEYYFQPSWPTGCLNSRKEVWFENRIIFTRITHLNIIII